jgi:hypothetical protein
VYILNVQFFKSVDAGKTITNISIPHGDNHDLWINPDNPQCMIEANDGGANVTYNGGLTWTLQDIPTAQFYHVTVDNEFPYNVYGAQQDNSTIRIASRTTGFAIDRPDWHDVGGGESGYIAPNTKDANIVYAGSYGGYLTRYDHRTKQEQNISAWPDDPMGGGAEAAKYRFQWTFPIVVSKHDQNVLYVTANVVFKSTNEGMSWEVISPDLTMNDPNKLKSSGGPITKDNTSVEYYCTIFTFAESPVQKGVLWAGTDDGLVHVSQHDGKSWANVTPKDIPALTMMSILEASPHSAGTAYLAANRYKLDDFHPYLYKTTDFGKSWKKIVKGIPENEFTHVIREDPNKKGLLYAGTERGVYVSFDDGEYWQPLKMNLPVVPIHDLAIQAREKDLVVATHGRSFWILDDLTPLHQLSDEVKTSDIYLFKPRETYRMPGGSFERPGLALGKNPPNGVVVYYYLKSGLKEKDTMKLEFLDSDGKLITSLIGKSTKHMKETLPEGGGEEPKAPADAGMNRFVWNMRYPDATKIPGAIMWNGNAVGPVAVPAMYQVRLRVGDRQWTQSFEIKKDPRLSTTLEDFEEQFAFLIKIRDTVSAAHEAVNTIRDIRKQTEDFVKRLKKHTNEDTVTALSKKLNEHLKHIEEEILQVNIKSSQDALNYPIKLNDKLISLMGVVSSADTRPTKQSYDVFSHLTGKLSEQLTKFKNVLDTDLAAFNNAVREMKIPVVVVKPVERK